MSYTWTKEDLGYRVPGRAYVGVSWKGWWHISLYDAARDLWVRQEGVYTTDTEAREWAELLLDEQVVG